MKDENKAKVDVAITPSTRVEETLEERAKKINDEFEQFVNKCLAEAKRGAVEFGLAETEEEAEAVVNAFMSKCHTKVWSLGRTTKFLCDRFALAHLARWVFTNYDTWQGLVDHMGETEAILSGACTLNHFEGEKEAPYGSMLNEVGILNRFYQKIKPVQNEIKQEERKLRLASIVGVGKPKEGSFAVYADNEIMSPIFEPNKKGVVDLKKNGEYLGSVYFETELKPIDIFVFASLATSIIQNTAKDDYGEEFFYVNQSAFCRAFFGFDKAERIAHESEKEIIRESIDRLVKAHFMNIKIEPRHTSQKYSYERGTQITEGESEENLSISVHPRYLPLYEYVKDLPTLVGGSPAWLIRKSDYYRNELFQLASKANRTFTLPFRLIPKGVRKTDLLMDTIGNILTNKVLRWSEKQKWITTIDLEELCSVVDMQESGTTRQAISKQKKALKLAIIDTLTAWEKAGLFFFEIGTKTRGRAKALGNCGEADKAKIKTLKLVKVDRSQMEKIDLKKLVPQLDEKPKEESAGEEIL